MTVALMGLVSCTKEDKNSEDATTTTETEAVETETPAEATPIAEVEEAKVAEEAAEVTEEPAAEAKTNIDELIASYDKVVTSLSETAKLAKKKDLNAISKFAKLTGEANALKTQLEQAKDQMSADQKTTFQQIAARMAQAITDAK